MSVSTWHRMKGGLASATHKSYMAKSNRQRQKAEVADVWNNFDAFVSDTEKQIAGQTYRIGEYRHFVLRDRKKERDISVLQYKDRCVQNQIKDAIEPVILNQLTDDMLAGLPNRGVQSNTKKWSVIHKVRMLMKNESLKWYLQTDVSKFYDNVENVVAMKIVEEHIKDKRTLAIFKQHLFAQKKLAIGDPMSHLIANLVMSRFIRYYKSKYSQPIVNFADDVLILSETKEELQAIQKDMRHFLASKLRLHIKRTYVRPIDDCHPIIFCGRKYTRDAVYLVKITKKNYIKARHRKRSMGSYNGILNTADCKHLRKLVSYKDNKHMAEKIRRPFAGKSMKIDSLVGIKHTIVNAKEKPSRQSHSESYYHVQAVADGFGLIVYCTSSSKLVQYLKENTIPMRDMVIAKDWSGYYYEGTIYTDAEEEEMIRKQFNI